MRRRKRDSPAQLLVLTFLLVVLCAVIFARCELASNEAEVSTAPEQTAAETVLTETLPVVTVLEQAEPEPPTPQPVERYSSITMTGTELQELAAVVYLEAANQSADGQQAVAEVVFNRVISSDFPDTVSEVLHQGENSGVLQFSTIGNIPLAEPTQAQYDAINAALYGPSILPADVVFFSRNGENSRVWGTIGDHVFCYGYVWK